MTMTKQQTAARTAVQFARTAVRRRRRHPDAAERARALSRIHKFAEQQRNTAHRRRRVA